MEDKKKDFSALSDQEKILYLYSDGAGDPEICRAMELTKEEFDKQCNSDKTFNRLVNFGRTIALAWWEEKLRAVAFGREKGDAQVIKLIMQNRYGWMEKNQTDNKGQLLLDGMTKDQLEQELRKVMPTLQTILDQKGKSH